MVGNACAANGVILDGALCNQRASQAVGGCAQGCHTLCDSVDELANGVDLGVNHLVNCDEAGAGHVPVGVLQNQVQVVQVVQTSLKDVGEFLAGLEGQAGSGVLCECHMRSPLRCRVVLLQFVSARGGYRRPSRSVTIELTILGTQCQSLL